MNFELACLEDFNEIENLYWDLIDKSKEEPSFPDWEKGVHPSADFLMAGIVQKELFVLRDERKLLQSFFTMERERSLLHR